MRRNGQSGLASAPGTFAALEARLVAALAPAVDLAGDTTPAVVAVGLMAGLPLQLAWNDEPVVSAAGALLGRPAPEPGAGP